MKKAVQPFVIRFESVGIGVLLLSVAPAIRAQTSLESASVADPAFISVAVPQTPSSTAAPQIQTPVDSTAAQTQTQTQPRPAPQPQLRSPAGPVIWSPVR